MFWKLYRVLWYFCRENALLRWGLSAFDGQAYYSGGFVGIGHRADPWNGMEPVPYETVQTEFAAKSPARLSVKVRSLGDWRRRRLGNLRAVRNDPSLRRGFPPPVRGHVKCTPTFSSGGVANIWVIRIPVLDLRCRSC